MCNTLITVLRFIAKLVQYNGVSSPQSYAKVIEILKEDLPLLLRR